MFGQDLPKLPLDRRWEYAMLTLYGTGGGLLGIGAKSSVTWNSTLEDEEETNFEESVIIEILHRVGEAGWELATSNTSSEERAGSTHQIIMSYIFKQRPATTEDNALAQLIDPFALLKRGLKYAEKKNSEMAMKAISMADRLKPTPLERYYLMRGRIYFSLGDAERGLDDIRKAIEANKQYIPAWMEAGNFRLHRNEYENALSNYNEAIRLIQYNYSDSNKRLLIEVLHNRGITYRQLGKAKEAINDFREYLKQAQPDAQSRSQIEGWLKDLESQR